MKIFRFNEIVKEICEIMDSEIVSEREQLKEAVLIIVPSIYTGKDTAYIKVACKVCHAALIEKSEPRDVLKLWTMIPPSGKYPKGKEGIDNLDVIEKFKYKYPTWFKEKQRSVAIGYRKFKEAQK